MRDYAKVNPRFWIGDTGRKLRSAGADAQVVALYLLSSPHANMLGIYYLPIAYIAHETGLSPGAARAALAKIIELGFCAYDDRAEVVWIYEMARFQVGEQLAPADKQVKGIAKAYLELPSNRFLGAFYERYKERFHLSASRGDDKPQSRPSEGPSKPHRSQEQEQEQDLPLADARGATGAVAPPALRLAKTTTVPDCPHQQIISMYHEFLPTCPQVMEWTEQRQGLLRARWREKARPNGRSQGYASVEAGLAYWRRFFAHVAESRFLTGQCQPGPNGRPVFVATLEWLLRPSNFAKVIEGNYHDAAA